MSAATPEPEPTAAAQIKVGLLAEIDEERFCDACGRRPNARKGCYAAVQLGPFVYLELCRRCAALAKRAFEGLP